MAKKLTKEEKKALIEKAEAERSNNPKASNGASGFDAINKEAEKLSK